MVFYLGILSSCGGSGTLYHKKKTYDEWIAQEAKLFDVPVLIDAVPEKLSEPDESEITMTVRYRAKSALPDAVEFYEQEMERYGWNLWNSFITQEALLIFEKPSKICAILIKPYKDQINVTIFSKPKD
jgi:hypothetical protein